MSGRSVILKLEKNQLLFLLLMYNKWLKSILFRIFFYHIKKKWLNLIRISYFVGIKILLFVICKILIFIYIRILTAILYFDIYLGKVKKLGHISYDTWFRNYMPCLVYQASNDHSLQFASIWNQIKGPQKVTGLFNSFKSYSVIFHIPHLLARSHCGSPFTKHRRANFAWVLQLL